MMASAPGVRRSVGESSGRCTWRPAGLWNRQQRSLLSVALLLSWTLACSEEAEEQPGTQAPSLLSGADGGVAPPRTDSAESGEGPADDEGGFGDLGESDGQPAPVPLTCTSSAIDGNVPSVYRATIDLDPASAEESGSWLVARVGLHALKS